MIFKKDNIIIHENKELKCICADKELAVFAPVKLKYNQAVKTWFNKELLVVCNDPTLNQEFKFESIDG